MTKFENLKLKNIDEFAEWLDTIGSSDDSPWINYFNDTYCAKCESEFIYDQRELYGERKCAWCELHNNKCKFFQYMKEAPNNIQMIKLWLESKY